MTCRRWEIDRRARAGSAAGVPMGRSTAWQVCSQAQGDRRAQPGDANTGQCARPAVSTDGFSTQAMRYGLDKTRRDLRVRRGIPHRRDARCARVRVFGVRAGDPIRRIQAHAASAVRRWRARAATTTAARMLCRSSSGSGSVRGASCRSLPPSPNGAGRRDSWMKQQSTTTGQRVLPGGLAMRVKGARFFARVRRLDIGNDHKGSAV